MCVKKTLLSNGCCGILSSRGFGAVGILSDSL